MGLQIQCPVCGMNRTPDSFRPREISAKQVQSLGGNRGMEHTPVAVPSDVERDLHRVIGKLHQRLKTRVGGGDEMEKVVQRELIGSEIEKAISGEIEKKQIEEDMGWEIEKGQIRYEIENAIEEETGR